MKRKAKRDIITIKEWLLRLPSPYKERALLNLLPSEADKPIKSLKWALASAFIWGETPEGGRYWRDFSKTI